MSIKTQEPISRALEDEIVRVHTLLARGDTEGARALLSRLQQDWPDAERLRRLAHAIAPPKASVRRGRRAPSREREYAWLREHAHEYPGRWLAVSGDQLIAADPDLKTVLAEARQTIGEQNVLLHKQPPVGDRR